jgi:hypothetical protein
MEWKRYGTGQLAKGSHGFYLIYQNLDVELKTVRWFAKYEGQWENSSRQGKCINFQFFDRLEDAQAFCEKHAQGSDVESQWLWAKESMRTLTDATSTMPCLRAGRLAYRRHGGQV